MKSVRFAIFAVCASVAAVPIASGNGAKRPIPKTPVTQTFEYNAFSVPLSEPAMISQALNRLTFGPTPGESAEVERLGLKNWLAKQLKPEKTPENPVLAAKLQPYESLRMNAHQIYLHYPPPQLIAAIARGRQPMPTDPELREVTEQLVNRYLLKQQAAGSQNAAATGTPDDADLTPKVPLTAVLSAAQIEALDHGKPEQKKQVLAAIPDDAQLNFAYALKPGQRRALLPLAPVPLQRKLLLSLAPPQVVLTDLASAKILRAAYSTHQLEEELTDFWFNHFNVFFDKGQDRFLLTEYERETIRPHVLGKFYDLLLATAKSPAMLFYLDNAESVSPTPTFMPPPRFGPQRRVWVQPRPVAQKAAKRGLNENYGRELMELHTLGVNGGYTQTDVIQVARCFTGWTITPPKKGSVFEFNPRVHDYGEKVVLGHVIRAGGGMEDGLAVLKILARSPQTAHHISLELAQRFVADNPPPSLVDRMAAAYMKTDGDIREVMRTMVLSEEFYSQGAYQAKIKTPFEMVVSAVRATNANVESPLVLMQQITQLGEPLYRKIEPTGYSSANAEWVSSASLLSRMNFSLGLVNNRIPGVVVDQGRWDQLAANDPMALARWLLDGDPAAATAAAIQKAIESADVRQQLMSSAKLTAPTTAGLIAGLVVGSPEFQRR